MSVATAPGVRLSGVLLELAAADAEGRQWVHRGALLDLVQHRLGCPLGGGRDSPGECVARKLARWVHKRWTREQGPWFEVLDATAIARDRWVVRAR